MPKDIHLVPDSHDDEWHHTWDCWCVPAEGVFRVSRFRTVRVVFHRETQEGESEIECE